MCLSPVCVPVPCPLRLLLAANAQGNYSSGTQAGFDKWLLTQAEASNSMQVFVVVADVAAVVVVAAVAVVAVVVVVVVVVVVRAY